ncbi:class I SAM-dependent methyltransferase [Paenibacillus puldeungensis]|uniref:Class I SAM-dependent methyltransferase n=1 Tax=Paenibacillus puldeungensis TaxID=696536 RepID=A0ABW3RWI8_9BACL
MATIKNVEQEVFDFYNAGVEKERLKRGIGKIEFERTKEIISRYLLNTKQVIYDIGGGTGEYARWLAQLGHEVHMFELAPRAVEHAIELQNHTEFPIHSIELADARAIFRPDESADMVLLMGPLYHLLDKDDRIDALKEAVRVLKKDGVLIVAVISRFGSTLWGLSVFGQKNDLIDEDAFMEMVQRELTDGQHIRPEQYPNFIARAFFHTPEELKAEIEEAGLAYEKTLSVEGPIWIVPAFEQKWTDKNSKERLMKIAELVEEQESLLGMSPHMLAISRKL